MEDTLILSVQSIINSKRYNLSSVDVMDIMSLLEEIHKTGLTPDVDSVCAYIATHKLGSSFYTPWGITHRNYKRAASEYLMLNH